jgi:hypothetical protein
MSEPGKRHRQSLTICCGIATVGLSVAMVFVGCTNMPPDEIGDMRGNTTDPTNGGARYIGANSCRQCHPGINDIHNIHAHAHTLTRVQGDPPSFPDEADRASVPNPPDGFAWQDIAYVVGGYTRDALFINNDGFLLTNGVDKVDSQWNLAFSPNGQPAEFVPYEPNQSEPRPYDFSMFSRHTTGAMVQDSDDPMSQDNRPGILGTWEEEGVQCESCHGPGSNHFTTVDSQVVIDTSSIYVNTTAENCGQCHTQGDDANVVQASDGYIRSQSQYAELLASGGHSGFACTTCHDPHVSTSYARDTAIRNECTACHSSQNMAVHEDKIYIRDGYVEELSCESCHMPFATRNASSATQDPVGEVGRMGDTRTHIFRINDNAVGFASMFSDDMTEVDKDATGRAAVTVDFVCLRCHNGQDNAFELTIQSAASIANNIHSIQGDN